MCGVSRIPSPVLRVLFFESTRNPPHPRTTRRGVGRDGREGLLPVLVSDRFPDHVGTSRYVTNSLRIRSELPDVSVRPSVTFKFSLSLFQTYKFFRGVVTPLLSSDVSPTSSPPDRPPPTGASLYHCPSRRSQSTPFLWSRPVWE